MRARVFTGGKDAFIQGHEAFLARVVTLGMDTTLANSKARRQAAITAAGLPARLGNIIRATRYPQRGYSIEAAGVIEERPVKRSSDAVNLLSVFNTGVTIFGRTRRWLAIPSSAVKQGKYEGFGARHRVTPAAWEAFTGLTLRFVPYTSKLAFLVADRVRLTPKGYARPMRVADKKGRSQIIFYLVPSVRLAKRFDWAAEDLAAHRELPGNIAAHWR